MTANCPPRFLAFLVASLTPLISASAVDFTENFDGVAIDETAWAVGGAKTTTVADGLVTWEADGGNWSAGNLRGTQRYFLPPPTEKTTIEWTLGPAEITMDNPEQEGRSLRYQIGIQSANETANDPQHWPSTRGGLWLDFESLASGDTTMATASMRRADDTKLANTNAPANGNFTVEWEWTTEVKAFRLELTETDYEWYSGDVFLGGGPLVEPGGPAPDVIELDSEFDNGYVVLALGMNLNQGRGTTSLDKIEVLNAGEPASTITAFAAQPANAVVNEPIVLSWTVDPAATVSIDQGIGSVDAFTVGGDGQVSIKVPDLSEAGPLTYTLSATKDGDTVTRELVVNVSLAQPVSEESFLDHFEGSELDAARWTKIGGKSFTVENSRVNWASDGGTWSSGEVVSVDVFPMPQPGKPTTVTWTLGPASVATATEALRSLRAQFGIVSSFDTNNSSRAHHQNSTGGIWLDIENWGSQNPNGVDGTLYYADETAENGMNGSTLAGFSVTDWTWATGTQEFSVVMTAFDFTWFAGDVQLGTETWENAGIDDEFVNGFRIMGMGGNWDTGSGEVSYESIEIENGAAIEERPVIRVFSWNPVTEMIDLSFDSEEGAQYTLQVSTDLQDGNWAEEEDEIESEGDGITNFNGSTANYLDFLDGVPERVYFRIKRNE